MIKEHLDIAEAIEAWNTRARVDRSPAEGAVEAKDAALTRVHDWIANTQFEADGIFEVEAIDDMVLAAIDFKPTMFAPAPAVEVGETGGLEFANLTTWKNRAAALEQRVAELTTLLAQSDNFLTAERDLVAKQDLRLEALEAERDRLKAENEQLKKKMEKDCHERH